MSIKKDIQTKGFHSEQEKAFVNLIHTAAHFESLFSHFIKDFGLSPQQYNVLRILRGQSPNAILGGELQKRMLHNMSNATRLVDKLVEKGLVDRSKNSNDKRQILVSINKQGLKLLAKLDNEVVNFDEKIMNLPEAQLMVLNLLLDDLRASSKE
ncbi:MAG: MarR family transcriptional regulator [Flavobacteriales bacterium]|jgi:DNA-binding MarR family transcriptional regulator|tara:strand:- start:8090 stop:8551 length:462 start_codon:yes stop_codon:yes gene_type:complete